MTDPDAVPTKPLPVVANTTATEPLAAAETAPIATAPAVATIPRDRSWIPPLVIGFALVVLLVLAVGVLPRLLAGEVAPAPSVTPTVEVSAEEAPPVEEEVPEPEQTPVVPIPEPTDVLPQPTEEPPAEPSPTPPA